MGILFLIVLFLLGAIVCKWLSKYFDNLHREVALRKQKEQYYKDRILEAVEVIEQSVTPAPQEDRSLEKLLAANEEIIRRGKVRDAIRDELGVVTKVSKMS